jgi:hypothetical protein
LNPASSPSCAAPFPPPPPLFVTDRDVHRLESHLLQLLQEAGWTEQLRSLCRERLRDPDARVGNYEDLRRAVDQEAREMVPEHVRVEMVRRVLDVLRGMVESD